MEIATAGAGQLLAAVLWYAQQWDISSDESRFGRVSDPFGRSAIGQQLVSGRLLLFMENMNSFQSYFKIVK